MRSYERMRGLLSDKPVAFHPQLARLFGGINAALLFQQIAFWSNTKDDSESGYGAWIWKTQSELEAETAMTRYEQEGARKALRRKGVIEESRRGVPARLHYRINWHRFFELVDEPRDARVCGKAADKDGDHEHSRLWGTGEQDRQQAANEYAENPPSNSENTQRDQTEEDENTSELSEAESAWLRVASSLMETDEVPAWFGPWCVGAELLGSTLRVRLPTSAKIYGETYAEITRHELGGKLAQAWRAVSDDPQAALELEEG